MSGYQTISVAGGDTATPVSLAKRVRFISQVCDLPKVKLLDCGCGAGEYVFALRERYGTDAWGIEYLENKVCAAKTNPTYGHYVKWGDLEKLDEPNCAYDVALLNEVLEHVPNEDMALREVYRVLRPGAKLIIFSPNRWFPFETHGVRLRGTARRISPAVPFIPYVPVGIGRLFLDYWARNYWPHELRWLVRQAGFTIETLAYIWQTFENISGRQPRWIQKTTPVLRAVAAFCESTPGLRRFGVSQVIVARRPQ
jgi:SAM-dependent methyltransferase